VAEDLVDLTPRTPNPVPKVTQGVRGGHEPSGTPTRVGHLFEWDTLYVVKDTSEWDTLLKRR